MAPSGRTSGSHFSGLAAPPLRNNQTEIEEDPKLIPVYQDEAHFQTQTTVTSGWFKKGSKPKVKSLPGTMNGEINLKHTPTDLNYRHFELKIHDDKGKIVENLRSFQSAQMKPQRNGIDDLAQYIFEHILRKNLKFRS